MLRLAPRREKRLHCQISQYLRIFRLVHGKQDYRKRGELSRKLDSLSRLAAPLLPNTQGKLASHGLTAMEQDDDVLKALARELVTEKGIGECAAAIWKTLNQQRAHHLSNLSAASLGAEQQTPESLSVAEPFFPDTTPAAPANALQLPFAF
jgi:hypothetical protein